MPIVKSKFRTGYFGQKIFFLCFFLIILGILINLMATNEEFSFQTDKFWAALILIAFPLCATYNFCIKEFKAIIISEEIILSQNIITKQKIIIRFHEIVGFSSAINTYRGEDGSTISDGLVVMEIKLKNGKTFHFSENEYENFHDLKRFIYEHVKIKP